MKRKTTAQVKKKTNSDTEKMAVVATLLARASIYRLFSEACIAPRAGEDRISGIITHAFAATNFLPQRIANRVRRVLREIKDTEPATWLAEHRRVFHHVFSADCQPWEVAYTCRHLFQQTQRLADIAGVYNAFGLEVEIERPDHISTELEFMAFLLQKEAYAMLHHTRDKAKICRDAQKKFFEWHLGTWAPSFADAASKKAAEGPYRALFDLLSDFLKSEKKTLKAKVEPRRLKPLSVVKPEEDDGECGTCDTSHVDLARRIETHLLSENKEQTEQ